MKIILLGDSITDMNRDRNQDYSAFSYGVGYPLFVQAELAKRFPHQCEVVNRGISGNRIVDIYARIKSDCWNLCPDVVSILVGVNDVWHEVTLQNGVDIVRYKSVYGTLIDETKKLFPNAKIMLMEPFVLHGIEPDKSWQDFSQVMDYANVVRELADTKDCLFVPLQQTLDQSASAYGADYILYDGVHPTTLGSKIIADEWIKAFLTTIK